MGGRQQSGLAALAAGAIAALMIVVGLALNVVNLGSNAGLSAPVGHDVVFSIWAIAYATVGVVIGVRRPGNAVGWLLLGAGIAFAQDTMFFEYANSALGPRPGPGGVFALWFGNATSTFALALIPLAVLCFPDGRLPSPRWRPVAWLSLGTAVCTFVGLNFTAGRIDPAVPFQNPVGIGGAGGILVVIQVLGWIFALVCFAAAGAATMLRLRRSEGELRQQMKWVAYAAAVLGVLWAQWTASYLLPFHSAALVDIELVVVTLAMAGVPVSMGIAILRYRLYGIDVIIRKTLVYALLVGSLGIVYLAVIALIERIFQTAAGQSSALAVTASTLVAAAVFQPLRARLQHAVDHRFYRDEYDAAITLQAFSGRLRDQIDLDTLQREVLAAVQTTLQPDHATLWLRPPPQWESPPGDAGHDGSRSQVTAR
jgi:hypothetical protein